MKKSIVKADFEQVLVKKHEARKKLVTTFLKSRLPEAKKQEIDDLVATIMVITTS